VHFTASRFQLLWKKRHLTVRINTRVSSLRLHQEDLRMRKLAVCCVFTLLSVGAAFGQENPPPTPPVSQTPPTKTENNQARSADEKQYSTSQFRWQLGFGYQYQRFGIGGVSANERFGTNTDLTYFWQPNFALEGAITTGFSSNSPAPLDYHTLIYAAGAKYPFWRKGRWEPWVHGLAGGAYVRHTQTASGAPSANGLALIGGGGVDFPLWLRFGARAQADFVGTRISGSFQKSIAISAGVVIYF
jgi:hypothetical protein